MELKTLKQKVKGLTDGGEDRGVSPVIGVILMVAITVILAAVIGAFVLGLGDEVGNEANAGVSVEQSSSEVTVTWMSEGNADQIEFGGDVTGDVSSDQITTVGSSTTLAVDGTKLASGDELTIIAVINPGGEETRTVIQTYEVK